jgi:serine phosphatase RsbU (regulator of sigma subunit)
MGDTGGYVLLEREDDAQPFDPLCRETARTLCLFLGELETSRIMRKRSAHDRKALEAARREHNEMKQLAALQHQNLEQSIRYARLASGSVMPPPSALNRMYEDAYLLFRPRDVVTGTFYWFGERYYKFMIAVADTRVPGIGGTFLTLLHHRLIDEIADDQALPKPRGMLLDLGERIKETLGSQQTAGAAAYQGLRIGLVSVDESVQVLRFAGADIPLWLVRDGEVKRLNSSTTPLGTEPFPGHRTEIKQHTLQLTDEDRVYVCTPGLLELKGGHDNSPFGAERFRKLLHDISILPLHDQPAALNLKIDEWLDGRPPSHDVLLLGLQMPE